MAVSDLLLKDQSPTPVPFAPESTDQGNNAAGTPIKRTMFGARDGALVTQGSTSDAPWDGAAAAPTEMAILKAFAAVILGVGGKTLPVSGTVTVAPQRVESLWTDDSGAYYVRVDLGGTITWTDLSGTAVSAPGTGARPAAGASVLLSRSSFQATAGGTGYSTGDYLDHFVTTDPGSGVVIGNFWVNLNTGLKLASAPASANVAPAAPLPNNAATASGVAAVVAALGGPLQVANVSTVTYSTVAASTAAQILGTTGAAGDYLGEILVVPTSTSPGAVTIQDGAGTAITIFAGGSNSVSNLVPFGIPLGVKSKAGGWKVTTGAGLSLVVTGNFS